MYRLTTQKNKIYIRVLKKHNSLRMLLCAFFISACSTQNTPLPTATLEDAFGMAIPYLNHVRKVDVDTRYAIGVRWVRRDINWESIERSRGEFDFSATDAAVNAEINGGVKILGILSYGNTLYNTNPNATTSYPPDTLDFFCRYVSETVTHFKDRIHVWEIWNEPNGPTFWKPAPNPREFGKLAVAAAQCIHAADPNAKVVLGGMVGNSDPIFFGQRAWGFLEDLLKAYPELITLTDVFALHPYTFLQNPIPEAPTMNAFHTGYIDMLTEFRRVIDNAGGIGKPSWATELGWHTAIDAPIFKGVSEELQAALLVRSCVIALANGIEKVFPYTYADGSGDLTESEAHFGMVRNPEHLSPDEAPAPKPAYYAYQTMAHQLAPYHFTEDLRYSYTLPGYVYAYRFESVIVAWTYTATMQQIVLDNVPIQILSITGATIPVTGKTITLSQQPVYIKTK